MKTRWKIQTLFFYFLEINKFGSRGNMNETNHRQEGMWKKCGQLTKEFSLSGIFTGHNTSRGSRAQSCETTFFHTFLTVTYSVHVPSKPRHLTSRSILSKHRRLELPTPTWPLSFQISPIYNTTTIVIAQRSKLEILRLWFLILSYEYSYL